MLLIKNGKIITMAGNDYDCGSILIKDKKIIDIGENINVDNNEECQVIDAKKLLGDSWNNRSSLSCRN